MLKTKGNSIIFGGCWAYKSCLRTFIGAPKVSFFVPEYGHFCKKCPSLRAQNGILGAQTKILRPLLKVQHLLKMMELPLVLIIYHSLSFEPITNTLQCHEWGWFPSEISMKKSGEVLSGQIYCAATHSLPRCCHVAPMWLLPPIHVARVHTVNAIPSK